MKNQGQAPGSEARQGGKRIPEQPRDCGPHVDTWPIMDAQAGDAAKAHADQHARPKAPGKP
jgi:hypothetical protein